MVCGFQKLLSFCWRQDSKLDGEPLFDEFQIVTLEAYAYSGVVDDIIESFEFREMPFSYIVKERQLFS